VATLEQLLAVSHARAKAAKFVVMTGKRPYYSTLATYPQEQCLGEREAGAPLPMQLNPVGDGFGIDLGLHGFATAEEARAALTEWNRRHGVDGRADPYIVALPIKINPARSNLHPGGFYDPMLSVVR
jgi:hypothetical protein